MGMSKAADATTVPTGKVAGEVDAAEVFTMTGGLVTAKGQLSDHGLVIKKSLTRAKAVPWLIGAVAILGGVVVVGSIIMISRRNR